MSEFVNVTRLRPPRLSDLAQHVQDAFVLRVAPEETYQPGRVSLEAFEFVPYALVGLSAALAPVAPGAVRSVGVVRVPLFDEGGREASAERTVTVLGPGDVLGLDPAQIVRRYPAPGTTNAEETFLAHVEFDRPELPWAFSAQPRGATMTPWLALVVLERSHAELSPGAPGRPQVVRTRRAELQSLGDAWAWAHAQVHATGAASAIPLSTRLSTAYAPANLSRLLCPRILTQDTSYVACVVPATDVGVRAGLGLAGGRLAPAWLPGGPEEQVVLPVYDSWEFRTGPDGDFARLARRLHGVPAPWAVGRRIVDTAVPGPPLPPLAAGEVGRRQVLRCALYSPAARPPDAPPDATWTRGRTTALRDALDRAAVLAGSDPATVHDGVPDLPIVGPRIYARFQRGGDRVGDATDWFAGLNLAPTHRVTAGLGTRVVAKDQEELMQAAWAQVGAVDEANRALQLAQLARHVAQSLHARLALVDEGRLLQISRPVHERLRLAGNTLTLAGQTARSATAPAALSGAFRRTVRPTGPLGTRLSGAERATLSHVVAAGGALRDFTRPYSEPDGVRALSRAALASLRPDAAAAALGLPPDAAMNRLTRAAATFNAGPALATVASTPAAWGVPDAGLDLAGLAAQHMLEVLNARVPESPTANLVAARSVGGLLAGLATSELRGTAPARGTATRLLDSVQHVSAGPAGAGGAVIPGSQRPGGGELPGVIRVGGAPAAPAAPVAGGSPVPAREAAAAGMVGGGGVGAFDVAGFAVHGTGRRAAAPAGPGAAAAHTAGQVPAAHRDLPVAGLSETAAGHVVGPIVRPGPVAGGVTAGNVGLGGVVRADGQLVGVGGVVRADGQLVGVGGVVTPGAGTVSEPVRLESFVSNEGRQLSARLAAASQVSADALRASLLTLATASGALELGRTPPRPALLAPKAVILARLEPGRTIVEAVRGRLGHPAWLPADWFADTLIRPIMATPHFDRPMYQALDDYNRDWLVPGLGLLPPDELVSVLETNDEFVEAFLLGLSDEMGRELLWRGYPTDSRATYFRRFWDAAHDELQTPIHRFRGGALGSHVGVGPVHTSGRVVIVVRGEIVRRYPDMLVQALRETGKDEQGRPLLPESGDDPAHSAEILFTVFLHPDVMLVGFDLTVTRARAEAGWWFVVAEHPSATRFQRTESDLPAGVTVGFARVGALADGGALASARLNAPTRVAFAADDFLPPVTG